MNKLLLHLTKLYLRGAGARFKEISTIKLPSGQEQEVIVFSSKQSFVLGQVTLFGTTIVHELVFRTQKLLNYVATHEAPSHEGTIQEDSRNAYRQLLCQPAAQET